MPSEGWTQQLPPHLRAFAEKLAGRPDAARQLARFSMIVRQQSAEATLAAARLIAEQARRIAPDDVIVRHDTQWTRSDRVPAWHFHIVNDQERNRTYREALRRHVKPGMIVFEAGTGSGVLAMFAAQAGARHVYTCEREPLLVEVARENIARNGLADRITVLPKAAGDVTAGPDLPERADLMVSELVDSSLLGENILAVMEDAWARLLKPGAIVLPDRAAVRGALVGGPPWSKFSRADPTCGLDLSALDRFAQPTMMNHQFKAATLDAAVSDDSELLHFDFSNPRSFTAEEKTFAIPIARTGIVDGFLQWIWLGFGPGLELANRPPTSSAWAPTLHVFNRSVHLRAGDRLALGVAHDRERLSLWARETVML